MVTHHSFVSILILLVSVCAGLPHGEAASAGLVKIRVGYPSPSASISTARAMVDMQPGIPRASGSVNRGSEID